MLLYFYNNFRKVRCIMKDERKIISVRVEPELHKKLKMIAVLENTTLQNYIIELIKKNMKHYEERLNYGKEKN